MSLSLEEFHRLYDGAKPAYENWYGEAVQKRGSTGLHGVVQAIIVVLLKNAGWNPAPEVRLKVRPDAEPVPDVIAVRGKFKGVYPVSAPELCIEILASGDTLPKAFEKAIRYLDWGTECVWIIDPDTRTAWTLSQGAEPVWISPNGALRVGETQIGLLGLLRKWTGVWKTSLTRRAVGGAKVQLGVSRQFFVRLLDEGKMAFHRVGTHRHVYLRDLISFRKGRDRKRHEAIERMAREAVKDGVYDEF